MEAANEFKDKTPAPIQLWQTDLTYLKVIENYYLRSDAIFARERSINGLPPAQRLAVRAKEIAPRFLKFGCALSAPSSCADRKSRKAIGLYVEALDRLHAFSRRWAY